MNCEEMQRKILLEESGELSLRERIAVAGHEAACEPCRAYRATIRTVHSLMKRAGIERMPDPQDVARRVYAVERPGSPRLIALRPWMVKTLTCAAALLVAAGVWLALPSRGRSERITELHALLTTMADGTGERTELHREGNADQELLRLARQLLLIEGLGDEELIVEEPSATDPLSHSTDALPAETCV